MKPPTLIQRPLANAVTARATTKTGAAEATRTTRDSAARRSKKRNSTQLQKLPPVGLKFESQYEMTEKRIVMMTAIS